MMDVLTFIKNYVNFIQPRFHPCCDYVLICRNEKQILKLSSIVGRVVFLAIGKYLNPTRYRQIIGTESAENLLLTGRHVSVKIKNIRRLSTTIYYPKLRSQNLARRRFPEKL